MGKPVKHKPGEDKGVIKRILRDRLFQGGVVVLSMVNISPIILIICKLVAKGYKQINLDFFTKKAPDTYEAMVAVGAGEVIPGGILNGITGTLFMVLLASLTAIPVGLLIAYFWVVKNITHGFSALAGSSALAIMMLPLIIRSTEETLKMIPDSIREAGFALGVPYHKIILKVLIPSGLSGLLTGILLAISRIIGETAPLMLTALGSMEVNFNMAKPTSAVPLLIWEFYNDPNMVDLIWSSSLFLMMVVLLLNLVSKQIIAKRS